MITKNFFRKNSFLHRSKNIFLKRHWWIDLLQILQRKFSVFKFNWIFGRLLNKNKRLQWNFVHFATATKLNTRSSQDHYKIITRSSSNHVTFNQKTVLSRRTFNCWNFPNLDLVALICVEKIPNLRNHIRLFQLPDTKSSFDTVKPVSFYVNLKSHWNWEQFKEFSWCKAKLRNIL